MGSPFDMAGDAEQAWTEFRGRLADRIAEMADGEIVSIEVEAGLEEDERAGAAPYVQVIGWGEQLVRAEVSSNRHLDERYALGADDEELVGTIGWCVPTFAEGEEPNSGSDNFYVDLERREADRLAVMTVRVLREVFGCLHPVFVMADGVVLETLEQTTGSPRSEEEPEAVEEPTAVFPESSAELQRLVDLALAPGFQGPLQHDDDGDIPVVCGESVVFVRVVQTQPAVDLYCEMVLDVENLERAAQEVGILNRHQSGARFYLRDGTVIATYRLHAWPFAPVQLRIALAQLTEDIDDLAQDLAARVGGHRFGATAEQVEAHEETEVEIGDEPLAGLLEMLYDGPVRPNQVAVLFDNDRGGLVRQLVRLRTGQDESGEHDIEVVLSHLRAALRFVANAEAIPERRRPLPPKPNKSTQLALIPDGQDTLEIGPWGHDPETSS